jgi:ABC-type lipoprotein release transport system permease subunit
MPLLVRIAWRNIWRQPRRTLITVGAMGVGVAACLAMIAFVDGIYAQAFTRMVNEGIGHVQVHDPAFIEQRSLGDVIEGGDEVLAGVKALPGAVVVSGRAFGYALLSTDDAPGRPQRSGGAQLVGVTPAAEASLSRVDRKIESGRYLGEEAGDEIVLGAGLAESLRARLGDEVVAVTQAADGSLGNELFKVVGVFRTGNVIVDRNGAYVHIDDLRSLLVLGDDLHEIAVVGQDAGDVTALQADVERLAPDGLTVRGWRAVNPMVAQMLSFQDVGNGLLLLIVFSVAALGVLNTMLMSVLERTRELGVMGALGLKPRQIVGLVMLETLALVAVAGAGGTALGLALDAYLVVYGIDLSGVMSSGFSFGGTSFSPVLKGAFRVAGVVQTLGGLVVISLLASLWPALRAARLAPVAAMKRR